MSWHYIARVWREENLKPCRSGTFKISKDPAFADKVADVVGLYLAPPGGAVVLSIDRETHPRLRPARHHQPVRRAQRRHRRSDRRVQAEPQLQEIHVVLDNRSTPTTPEVKTWLAGNPQVRFHFTPVGSSWSIRPRPGLES
ncbi:hypothetical protein [Streptomyces sp. NPDC001401]|uniref:hypothetical protein n=1 Tax=Streptomyces sp. NPDC001401 TaxID=3364570 RepID=UPI00368CE5A8